MHTLEQVLRSRLLVAADPADSVLDVLERMAEARVGAIVVLDGERLVGVFSERDLMTRVVVPGRDPGGWRVADVMTRKVITAEPDERRGECLDKMQRARCRHLPVLEDGELVAMLSMRDLLRDEIEEQVEEIQTLRAYLHQTPPA
jgi:CBS domain-containing protein